MDDEIDWEVAPMFVSKAAIESYNTGVRDGFIFGFISGIVLALVAKALKVILKNKATA